MYTLNMTTITKEPNNLPINVTKSLTRLTDQIQTESIFNYSQFLSSEAPGKSQSCNYENAM